MPVAVKFSERFYEKFGHEPTDEFVSYLNQIDTTYRSELRELNELNYLIRQRNTYGIRCSRLSRQAAPLRGPAVPAGH